MLLTNFSPLVFDKQLTLMNAQAIRVKMAAHALMTSMGTRVRVWKGLTVFIVKVRRLVFFCL